MKSENQPAGNTLVDNELDIRGLFHTLWRGKPWIIAIAVLFGVIALLYSYLVKQEWSATAITDKPTVNMLGGYYSQQQFLRNLDAQAFSVPQGEQPSISSDVYAEFIVQLAAYDTRRDFWLQTDYYKQRQEGDAKADAALLDELVNNIQFTPRDDAKKTRDTVKLVAETSADANTLLRQYVVFASQQAAGNLNEEITGAWAARTIFIKSQIKRQEAVARAIYEREIQSVEQGLKIAQQQGISRSQTDTPADELPASEMFLLGRPMLQARLESLQASGPHYDREYDQNRAMLTTLNVGPTLNANFQTYRYLRTPEEPVRRDSPRRAFLMVMWGAIGTLVGAGFALVRRSR
ncbi:ECA polysaccharide chain length modulation protein [Brenneria izbisi]|uniref:ECA polysaccharide chain length modulation protein n=1 Tax=Brenneria izbisi TaxID=2939450 RepID=A0AA41XY56_9GAMM|nr:ECA polysaccharide chain length modulation protein [Brenneria izbisi]MCV9879330.1 ECA polysaccharide chain length modulation protein [Brenneria izbisi]MCV9882530.1 ECA polysaccharide chain length modulation protein [Brenneria izbisi]